MSHATMRRVFRGLAVPIFSTALWAAPQCPVWQDVGTAGGLTPPHSASVVNSAVVMGQGSSSALYIGGDFSGAGGANAVRLARWDGSSWSALGGNTNATITALAVFDAGSGPELYAGGGFLLSQIGGVAANGLGRWDGTTWNPVGLAAGSSVIALTAGDIGSGPSLFVAGSLSVVLGGFYGVGRWDGAQWHSVGSGFNWHPIGLCIVDLGSGPTLFVIRRIPVVGGSQNYAVARWTGSSWIDICNSSTFGQRFQTLAALHSSAGTRLVIGGTFTNLNGFPANNVVTWNGTSLATLGSGPSNAVSSLAEFDDGTGAGPLLVAGLDMAYPNASAAAVWNGSTWTTIGSFTGITTGDRTFALAAFDDHTGAGPGLYALGGFAGIQATSSSCLAVWRGCNHAGVRTCPGDGSAGSCPCGNNGAPGRGCENSASTGGALLDAAGLASVAQDTLVLSSSGELPTALSIFLQGTQEIAPLPFGDGLRCTGGTLRRLYTHTAILGSVSAPLAGELPVSARSAALGDPLQGGARRSYQVYYRDPSASFCPAPPGNTWNVSSGVRIDWLP